MSLKQKLIEFLATEPKHLKEIYTEFKDEKPTTIRGRLNENVEGAFKRIARGVYLAIQGDAKALIIEGDAWEVIKELDDDSIDAIITDSGYTCLNKHYEIGSSRKRNQDKSIGFATKDIDNELLSHMHRILKPGGHFFSFLPADAKDTLDYNNRFIQTARKVGFIFNKRFIWDKVQIGMGYNGRNRYEQIIFLSKRERNMPNDLSIPDVLTHKRIDPRARIHPAQKPVELIKDIMRFCTKKNDIVLDPFGGSMSTAFAGLELERHTICIEIDQKMIWKVINQRNRQATLINF